MSDSRLIRIVNLSHTYARGGCALRNLTFEVAAGERLALVGPNGAGKTTLFLRMCGVLPGQPGQILIAGLDPAVPQHRRHMPQKVGIVFQNPEDQLFSATLLEDVAFGPLNLGCRVEEALSRAETALKAVGLHDFADRSPDTLSGGEKRRAALAGVLAMQPEVLLLDEPSMYLDPRSRRELIQQLTQLPGTLLIATHDLDLVLDLCPRTLILDAGEKIADGESIKLLADQALMQTHGLEVPYRLR